MDERAGTKPEWKKLDEAVLSSSPGDAVAAANSLLGPKVAFFESLRSEKMFQIGFASKCGPAEFEILLGLAGRYGSYLSLPRLAWQIKLAPPSAKLDRMKYAVRDSFSNYFRNKHGYCGLRPEHPYRGLSRSEERKIFAFDGKIFKAAMGKDPDANVKEFLAGREGREYAARAGKSLTLEIAAGVEDMEGVPEDVVLALMDEMVREYPDWRHAGKFAFRAFSGGLPDGTKKRIALAYTRDCSGFTRGPYFGDATWHGDKGRVFPKWITEDSTNGRFESFGHFALAKAAAGECAWKACPSFMMSTALTNPEWIPEWRSLDPDGAADAGDCGLERYFGDGSLRGGATG